MNTKYLLTSSAIFLGILGFVLTFMPQEVSHFFLKNDSLENVLFLQLLGALYLGFAIQNWFVKGSLIGGIYNKPILMGNIIHFTIGFFSLLKSDLVLLINEIDISIVILIMYAMFTISFFLVTFSAVKKLEN